MKRIGCLLLALFLIACTVSCNHNTGFHGNENNPGNQSYELNYYDVLDKGARKGGTLRLFCTIPDTLNPILTKNEYVQGISSFIYESLFKISKDQQAVPVLCDKWDISDDGLVWTFHVRENVAWHDGMPMSAEDVEFTIKTILRTDIDSPYKSNLSGVISFSALDTYRIRVILKKPNSFLAELMTFPIVPKHCFDSEGAPLLGENTKPIGTGPFAFESYEKDKLMKLRANEKWWNSQAEEDLSAVMRLPYISEIEIKFYENLKDVMSSFQSGDIDMALLSGDDYDRYAKRTDMQVKKFTDRNFEFIAFNLQNPVCREKAVRQAFALSIDRAKLVDNLAPGKATISDIPLMPSSWLYGSFYNEGLKEPDPEKAKETLIQDGWKERNGVLYKNIKGVMMPLRIEMLVNQDNALRVRIAEYIKQQVRIAGIDLVICSISWEQELNRINQGKFSSVLIGCTVPSIPDISFMYSSSYLDRYSAGNSVMATNIAKYVNSKVDELVNELYCENSPERKKEIFYELRAIITDDAPYIGLFFHNNAVLFSKRVRGSIDPYVWDRFNNFAEWYIPY